MTKKILVTGGDGFIGSHLVELLVNLGYEVVALAQYNSFGSRGWLDTSNIAESKSCDIVLGDIRDYGFIDKHVRGCHAVCHLASLIGIPHSYLAPSSYVATNVEGTLNILEACLKHDVEKLIHTSTSEVYGTAQSIPMKESHPLVAQSPYAASKIAADQLVYSYYASFGLNAVIARPFNTFGPRQSARAVIPAVIKQIISGSQKILLGNTASRRDFNFVGDTIDGFVRLLEFDETDVAGETFNFCSGIDFSVAEVVGLILEIFNSHAEIVQVEGRIRPDNSEVERLLGDSSKAQDVLGWRSSSATINGFIKNLGSTCEWFKENEGINSSRIGEYYV